MNNVRHIIANAKGNVSPPASDISVAHWHSPEKCDPVLVTQAMETENCLAQGM